MYIYAWRTPALGGKVGTFHAADLIFVFDNASICMNYSGGTPAALALSSRMGEAWASMARSAKPGNSGLPEWPAHNETTRATMVFDVPCAVRSNPEGEGLRLIKQSA